MGYMCYTTPLEKHFFENDPLLFSSMTTCFVNDNMLFNTGDVLVGRFTYVLLLLERTILVFNSISSGIAHANLTSGRRSHRPPWRPMPLKIRKKYIKKFY
jgi:hypothetical protein